MGWMRFETRWLQSVLKQMERERMCVSDGYETRWAKKIGEAHSCALPIC